MDNQPKSSESKQSSIRELFTSMMTDDVPDGLYEPESSALAKDWLKEKEQDGIFIIGSGIRSDKKDVFTVINPCNNEKLTDIFLANESHLEKTLEIASKQFHTWKTDGMKRAEYLINIARNIENHKQLFALLESITTAKPIRRVRTQDLPLLIQSFDYSAGCSALFDERTDNRSPLGVVYVIASCGNYPLMSLCWNVASALAAGNVVILEVDASSCLSAAFLADMIEISGVPEGVFSVLPQKTPFLCSVTNPCVLKKNLSKIFFTGSFEDSQKLKVWNKLHNIELETHATSSPPTALVLEGADISSAVQGIMELFCFNDPRSKAAGCRVLVQDSIKDTLIKKLCSKFKELRVGSCLSNSDISAIFELCNSISCPTLEEIEQSGAKVCSIQNFHESEVASVPPSIIYNIQTSSQIMHGEIGGQFVRLASFRTMKEGIKICNYARSGSDVSIWCENLSAVLEAAHCLKAANVWINCQNAFDPSASFGSVYTRGNASRGGEMAIYSFTKPAKMEKDIRNIRVKSVDEIVKQVFKAVFWNDTFQLYYGGAFKNAVSNSSRKVHNRSGIEIGYMPDGSRKDIRNAVECAASAQEKWESKKIFDRAHVLVLVAVNLNKREKEFAYILHAITEQPLDDCIMEVQNSVKRLFYWSAMWEKFGGQVKETSMYGKVLETMEPLGVLGIICPDDAPLLSFVSLVSSAIVKGNTVVLVPSEKYPYPALRLCEVFDMCGIPSGVINVVSGSSKTLTKVLAAHMEVDAIWMLRNCSDCINIALESATTNQKRIWIDDISNWFCHPGKGVEFLLRATYTKTVWLPIGNIFAN